MEEKTSQDLKESNGSNSIDGKTKTKKEVTEELWKKIEKIRRKYEIFFGYYASWKFPKSKDVRQSFVATNIQLSFAEALLVLFVKYFGPENIAKDFETFFTNLLQKKIDTYREQTGMKVTMKGLLHDAE